MRFNFLPEKGKINIDPSVLSLLAANVITIFFALYEHWSLITVMWVYWFQSVTIGFFNFIRILQLKEYLLVPDYGRKNPGIDISFFFRIFPKISAGIKIFLAFFFLFHYGGFHLGYAVFLNAMTSGWFAAPEAVQMNYVYLTAVLFFLNHLISYIFNRPKDTKKQSINALMSYPYARIIPMHLTIILGGFFMTLFGGHFRTVTLLFFLVLKTAADLSMHFKEHQLRKGEETDTGINQNLAEPKYNLNQAKQSNN